MIHLTLLVYGASLLQVWDLTGNLWGPLSKEKPEYFRIVIPPCSGEKYYNPVTISVSGKSKNYKLECSDRETEYFVRWTKAKNVSDKDLIRRGK